MIVLNQNISLKEQYQILVKTLRGNNMTKKTTLVDKLDAMEKALEEGYKGIITDIKEATNEEYYGTKGTYSKREGLEVSVKIDREDGNGEEFDQFFALPKTTGLRQSNIGLFKKRYGSFPKVGIKVDVVINDDGFFRVVV